MINTQMMSVTLSHDGGFYGNDIRYPGYFEIEPELMYSEDLNKDGLDDLIMRLNVFPHTVSSNSVLNPFFSLLNNGDGTFTYSLDFFESGFERDPYRGYRSIVKDFNNDGELDFFIGMGGKPVISKIDGGINGAPGLPILSFKNNNGKFYNASSNLDGIYPGTIRQNDLNQEEGIPNFLSDRAITAGDFNNDGNIDISMTSKILYNDGKGFFTVDGPQMDDKMNPTKIGRNTHHIYESFSDDFNNDGFFDIIIAPDSQFIEEYGGSGWVVMSDGTSNVKNWTKVNLPDPMFPFNSKLNHIKTIDYNQDGFRDIVIGTSKNNPYYKGVGIQILKNNGDETFSDVTNTNVSNQSFMDTWQGEEDVFILDINNDGINDILHNTGNTSDGPPNIHHGSNIYINRNGFFELYDTQSNIPKIWWAQFEGFERFLSLTEEKVINHIYPVNINNSGWIDFISYKQKK